MTVNLTLLLENEIKSFSVQMKSIWLEAQYLYSVYWKAGPQSEISGLSSNTAVTVSTKLTKSEIVNGVTFCEQLEKFFTNQAVTTGDYLATIENIYYGNDAAVSQISVATEALGTRLYNLSSTCIAQFSKAITLIDFYYDTEIYNAVNAISSNTVVFGSNVNKSLLTSGVVLLEQYKKMINNEAVTTGDYDSTIQQWELVG